MYTPILKCTIKFMAQNNSNKKQSQAKCSEKPTDVSNRSINREGNGMVEKENFVHLLLYTNKIVTLGDVMILYKFAIELHYFRGNKT